MIRVLEKKFYVVVPFTAPELGISTSTFNPLAKAPQKPPFDLDYIEEKSSMALYPRRDHIIRQFARLGLRAQQLTTPELVSLFYTIYNQSAAATATTAQSKAISGISNNK